MKRSILLVAAAGISSLSMFGCAPRQPASMMAPPVTQQMGQPMSMAPGNQGMNPGMNQGMSNNGTAQGGVYNWQDVPVGQQVGISRAQFDQGGYQLVADTGDTIVVPFVNNNLYVMKFGRSGGGTYFVNENGVPTLYVQQGFGVANAAAQGALWYPLPTNFTSTRPVYVGIAPSWNDYLAMGWYPGMHVYGGMWGYNSYGYSWMPGFYININNHPYYGWSSYHTYYVSTPGYYRTTYVNRSYYNTAPRGTGSFRYTGSNRSTGSFSSGRTTGSFPTNRSTGSFPSNRSTGGFPSGRTSGSFPSNRSTGGSFSSGSGPTTVPRSSFNSGSSSFTPRSSTGSMSGGRSTGGSFMGGGGSRPSGSFNSGRRH